jgi:iron complex outermembrane receptor protein
MKPSSIYAPFNVRHTLLAAAACMTPMVQAQDAPQVQPQPQPQQIVITGSPTLRSAQDAPYAITVVDRDELRSGGPMINLSEALVRVPGLVVNNRSNFAQDLQISSRGFGARATFGVRGIRLYVDGIPATGPDGQGQVSHFDIAGAARVEVLRGPFSVLYGNSSGGVIALFGAPAKQREVEADVDIGSFGLRQVRFGLALPLDNGLDVQAHVSQAEIDGFRPQSQARKRQANARLGWQGANDTVTLLVNDLDQPAQDPLGLTRAQFNLGPEQTAQQAIDFNTRKTTRQTQAGVNWQHRFGEGALRETQLTAYTGQRSATQWLAIPAGAQASPKHGGGVIDIDRNYSGLDARARFAWERFDLVAGMAIDNQRDDRRGYLNYTGTTPNQVFGVIGTIRRDEINRAESKDAYVQGEWAISDEMSASAGIRSGRLKQQVRDSYLSNGDDSGDLSYSYTNPVLGMRWKAAKGLQLYANLARGFESPTLGELAYRPDGSGGFNSGLKPQRSHQFEMGAKWRDGAFALDAAVFEVRTSDEIGVVLNSGGRSAFQNVGRTLRRGVELGATLRPSGPWRMQLAASLLDATYRDDFLTCDGTPCTTPTATVPAGNRIAGTPRANAWTEIAWNGAAWGEWALELRASGNVAVNDRNTDFAAGYGLAGLRWSKTYPLGMGGARMEWLIRIDNLANRAYAGSVIVNDGNGRYFEPGAPRNALVALRLIGVL